MLKNMSEFFSSNSLYSLRDDMPKLSKFLLQRGHLSPLLATLPESLTNALSIALPRPSQVQVKKTGEDVSATMRPNSQPDLTAFDRHQSLLFTVVRWVEPRLSTKRSRSQKKITM